MVRGRVTLFSDSGYEVKQWFNVFNVEIPRAAPNALMFNDERGGRVSIMGGITVYEEEIINDEPQTTESGTDSVQD